MDRKLLHYGYVFGSMVSASVFLSVLIFENRLDPKAVLPDHGFERVYFPPNNSNQTAITMATSSVTFSVPWK